MSYKIDSHKLESVTKSLFYDSTWTRESGGFRNLGSKTFISLFGPRNVDMEYLSTDGKVITNVNNLLSDEQNEQFIIYAEHRFTAIWSMWKYIRESPKEEKDIKSCLVPFSIEKFIDSSKPLGKLDENELHELCWNTYRSDIPNEEVYKNRIIEDFLRYSRMIRLQIPNLYVLRGERVDIDGRVIDSVKTSNDLNIMSYYPLTHSQRSYLLDYIERYNVSPDRVFIDDYSKEKSIKRQLGLQFF